MEKGMIDQYDQDKMSAQQQDALEEYVYNGYRLIYDPSDAILKMATANKSNKVESVANAAMLVAKRLDASRESKGRPPFPDEIKVVGGHHIVEKIIEFAETATKKRFTQAEKQAALEKAYQTYMEDGIKNRTIDPAQLAVSAEKVQPGAVTNQLAALPDDIQLSGQPKPQQPAGPPGAGQVPPGQQPPSEKLPEKKGLLQQPSPLERFL